MSDIEEMRAKVLAADRKRLASELREGLASHHGMLIDALTLTEMGLTATVRIDGIDITRITAWVDTGKGEAGVYPHRLNEDGNVRILSGTEWLPLLGDSPTVPPGNEHLNEPIVVRGKVELAINE